jgi:hypothetical protein
MSLALSPVIGTIHIEPLADDAPGRLREADDSTLGSLLAEFAHRECLADLEPPRRLIAAGRLSRFGIGPEFSQSVVRADLARLLDDLQAEYDELESLST